MRKLNILSRRLSKAFFKFTNESKALFCIVFFKKKNDREYEYMLNTLPAQMTISKGLDIDENILTAEPVDYMNNYFVNRYGAIKEVDFSDFIEQMIKGKEVAAND